MKGQYSHRFALLISLFFIFAQNSLSQNPYQPVSVNLSFADRKKIYKTGETIRLVMSFTSTHDGYSVSTGVESSDTIQDEVMISPTEGVFDWKKAYMRGAQYTSDAIVLNKLSAEPVKIELPLNYFVRFDAVGKYSVRVKTKRAGKYEFRSGSEEPPLELTTNDVSFEVQPMTRAEETAEVVRLAVAIDKASGWQEQARLADELGNLAGDAAIPEKVKRYFSSQTSNAPGNYFGAISRGLTITRNLPMVIKLLESVFRDKEKPANYSLLGTLTGLVVLNQGLKSGIPFPPRSMYLDDDSEYKTVRDRYVSELIESLPERKGQNQSETAITILQNLPRENASVEALTKLKSILLKNFDSLEIFSREHLLSVYWDKIGDASLAPQIERMLKDKSYPDYGRSNVHSIAIKRLIEIDVDRARPFVISEIKDPASGLDDEILGQLPDKTLSDVDEALVEQITKFADNAADRSNVVRLRAKGLLAARFATERAYGRLLDVYKTHSSGWQSDSKGILLGYFARYNDAEATQLIEQELEKIEDGAQFTFLTSLTKVNYSEGMNEVLKRLLFSNSAESASTAAYLMGKYGPPENRGHLEKRLELWLKEWRGKSDQLIKGNGDDAVRQAMVQVNIIDSLRSAKSWKLSIGEQQQLRQNCISEMCEEHFKYRTPQ